MTDKIETLEERQARRRHRWQGDDHIVRRRWADEDLEDARSAAERTIPRLIEAEREERDEELESAASAFTRKAAREHVLRAQDKQERIGFLEDVEDEKRALANLIVRSEPRAYGPGSPNSYYLDLAHAALPGQPQHAGAVERLERHSHEVAVEARSGRSAEGKRALRAMGTRGRTDGRDAGSEEMRALTTASSSGGAFVTPEYLLDQGTWAMYRTFPASFTEQATQVTDPGFGLTMHVPSFTGTAGVSEQNSETSGVDDSSPGGLDLTFTLLTAAGEVEISQQLLDLTGPSGYEFDKILYAQLEEDLRTETDTLIVTQAISAGTSVTPAGSLSVADLFGDIGKAKAALTTAAGAVLPATHIFMTPQWCEYLLSVSDPNGRPVLLPTSSNAALPIQLAPDGGPPPGWTGDRLTGTPLFSDGNIPASGSNTQFLVTNMAEVFVQRSEPVLRTIPETFATTLSVVVQAYSLIGVILRHSAAVQTISGSAYPTSPTFA